MSSHGPPPPPHHKNNAGKKKRRRRKKKNNNNDNNNNNNNNNDAPPNPNTSSKPNRKRRGRNRNRNRKRPPPSSSSSTAADVSTFAIPSLRRQVSFHVRDGAIISTAALLTQEHISSWNKRTMVKTLRSMGFGSGKALNRKPKPVLAQLLVHSCLAQECPSRSLVLEQPRLFMQCMRFLTPQDMHSCRCANKAMLAAVDLELNRVKLVSAKTSRTARRIALLLEERMQAEEQSPADRVAALREAWVEYEIAVAPDLEFFLTMYRSSSDVAPDDPAHIRKRRLANEHGSALPMDCSIGSLIVDAFVSGRVPFAPHDILSLVAFTSPLSWLYEDLLSTRAGAYVATSMPELAWFFAFFREQVFLELARHYQGRVDTPAPAPAPAAAPSASPTTTPAAPASSSDDVLGLDHDEPAPAPTPTSSRASTIDLVTFVEELSQPQSAPVWLAATKVALHAMPKFFRNSSQLSFQGFKQRIVRRIRAWRRVTGAVYDDELVDFPRDSTAPAPAADARGGSITFPRFINEGNGDFASMYWSLRAWEHFLRSEDAAELHVLVHGREDERAEHGDEPTYEPPARADLKTPSSTMDDFHVRTILHPFHCPIHYFPRYGYPFMIVGHPDLTRYAQQQLGDCLIDLPYNETGHPVAPPDVLALIAESNAAHADESESLGITLESGRILDLTDVNAWTDAADDVDSSMQFVYEEDEIYDPAPLPTEDGYYEDEYYGDGMYEDGLYGDDMYDDGLLYDDGGMYDQGGALFGYDDGYDDYGMGYDVYDDDLPDLLGDHPVTMEHIAPAIQTLLTIQPGLLQRCEGCGGRHGLEDVLDSLGVAGDPDDVLDMLGIDSDQDIDRYGDDNDNDNGGGNNDGDNNDGDDNGASND